MDGTKVKVYVDGELLGDGVASMNIRGKIFAIDNMPISDGEGIRHVNFIAGIPDVTLSGYLDVRYLNPKTRKYLRRYRRRGERMRKG